MAVPSTLSSSPSQADSVVSLDDPILITGAQGFIGTRVVERLLALGFRNLRCFARPSSDGKNLQGIIEQNSAASRVEMFKGNLLSKKSCRESVEGVRLIYHLAAGRGEKSIPDSFMNSVVTTRNLLDAAAASAELRRFVSVSSFAVYSNREKTNRRILDETSPIESKPHIRGDAYSYSKIKQDQLIEEYGRERNLPYVIVRPGVVYGPGNEKITGRVGIGTFGIFLHLGGNNPIPFTFVDNCADAIVLAGQKTGVDGQVFNIVDDEPLTSRQFLKQYKRHVKNFRSIYLPRFLSYFLCAIWEKYSDWSQGQLPPVYNRAAWHAFWKKTRYSNQKLKSRLGWTQRVPSNEAFALFFESCRTRLSHG
jgi:nucleoside-diphosphate-sugar epimerase